MRTKNTAIDVHFVDDDKTQMTKKVGPFGVMRQDGGVQHVGIGEDESRLNANGGSGRGGGVAVVSSNTDFGLFVIGGIISKGGG